MPTGNQDTDAMLSFLDKVDGDVAALDDANSPEMNPENSRTSPEPEGKLPSRSDSPESPPGRSAGEEDPSGEGTDDDDDEIGAKAAGDEDPAAGADAATEEMDAAEFAAYFGVEESDLVVNDDGTVAFKYKVGDESGSATLKDLVRGYQLERNLNQKSERLSEEVRQTQEARARLIDAIDTQNDLLESLKTQVTSKYDKTNWAELEEDDPGRAALMRQQMAEEFQNIESQLSRNRQHREAALEEAAQRQQVYLAEFFKEEEQKFIGHVPEWGVEKTRDALAKEFRSYLSGLGFNDSEMGALRDHRMMRIVRDAVEFRKLASTKLPAAQHKVVKVPRRLRAGSRPDKAASQAQRKQSAMSRVRESGSDRDAVAAFLAIEAV